MMSGMAVEGVVREWHPEQGWGVIDAQDTPGGCWAHFSNVAIDGYRELARGQVVCLEWEAVNQEGFCYRARRVWPKGAASIDSVGETVTDAYSSTVRWSFDLPE